MTPGTCMPEGPAAAAAAASSGRMGPRGTPWTPAGSCGSCTSTREREMQTVGKRLSLFKMHVRMHTHKGMPCTLTSRSCSCVLEAPPSRLFTRPPMALLLGPAPSVHPSLPVTMSRMDMVGEKVLCSTVAAQRGAVCCVRTFPPCTDLQAVTFCTPK